jgi:hypothetical protein
VGRTEAATGKGEVFDIVNRINDIVSDWRAVAG